MFESVQGLRVNPILLSPVNFFVRRKQQQIIYSAYSSSLGTMNKSQYYLSQCVEAASKSPMCFTLGAVMVKGGKVISTGYNHHRPHYDGGELATHGLRKPVSMHAEMHAIYNCTGMSPSFKTQVQALERSATCQKPQKSRKLPKQPGVSQDARPHIDCNHLPDLCDTIRSRCPQTTPV